MNEGLKKAVIQLLFGTMFISFSFILEIKNIHSGFNTIDYISFITFFIGLKILP
ncbi:MAG: hypothetical protein IJ851_05265 [Eubacterium sp.]|nr:hypothetical protein [Eubacterium sp.]